MSRGLARAALLALSATTVAGYKCTPAESMFSGGKGRMSVTTICLSGPIEGALEHREGYRVYRQNFFMGPSPMHAVADVNDGNTIFFSWTEDRPWGKGADEGMIHVTKVALDKTLPPFAKVMGQVNYPGFVRASDLDITLAGKIGVLCAKHVPEWSRAWMGVIKARKPETAATLRDGMAPLLLAVCEVDSKTMRATGRPWRIGTPYGTTGARKEESHAGAYPKASWWEIRDNGYGWLTYAPTIRTWTTWYGATAGLHTGFSMHTFEDRARIDPGPWELPVAGVENRVEEWPGVSGRKYHDHHRHGTGDHQMGSMTRYNRLLGDIAIVKHHHIPLYMQQYGLETPRGRFDPGPQGSGHKHGRVELSCPLKGDVGRSEGAIRPCGRGWIIGMVTDKGNVCARVNQYGKFVAWNVIEPALWQAAADQKLKFYWRNRMVRMAPVGSPESDARCGSEARFLMGYWTNSGPKSWDPPRRWLVEVDGDCNKVTTPWEVTNITTWPKHQEWVTTKDGSVAWVTAWAKTADGKPIFNKWGLKGQKGHNNGMYYFEDTQHWEFEGADRGVQNEAHVMVYTTLSPSRRPYRPGAWTESGEMDFSTDVCNRTSPFANREGGAGDAVAAEDGQGANGTEAQLKDSAAGPKLLAAKLLLLAAAATEIY